jgi:Skp family chaperone for outer membrane proteins
MTRSILTTLTVLALVALVSPALAQAPIKIGIFDSQRISEETAEGKRVQARLSEIRDAKQQQITEQEQAISELQQRLNQQGLSLSVETRGSLELEIQRRALSLNTAKDLAGRQLQLEVAAEEAQFNEKLRVVVTRFGQDENFSLLLELGVTAWAANSVDVTTALIDLFDQLYPPENP